MSNKKTKIGITVLPALTILTTGCGISVTMNYNYGQQEESWTNRGRKNNIPANTLTNIE